MKIVLAQKININHVFQKNNHNRYLRQFQALFGPNWKRTMLQFPIKPKKPHSRPILGTFCPKNSKTKIMWK